MAEDLAVVAPVAAPASTGVELDIAAIREELSEILLLLSP